MVVRIGQNRVTRLRVYFKEWRKFRRLTLEQVAERADTTKSAIQKLETGETMYNQSSLEALAEALTTTPAELIAGPPSKDTPPTISPEVAKAIDVLVSAGFGKR